MIQGLRQVSGREVQIFPTARPPLPPSNPDQFVAMDVTDGAAVTAVVEEISPTHIVHLAGFSTIAEADHNHEMAWRVHLGGTLNIARAIEATVPQCTLIYAGSGQVYGATGRSGPPLHEGAVLAPTNIQMVTKAAADLALGALAEEGLRCVRFRPFNHTGPGQSERFAIPNFAMQLARIKTGQQEPLLHVGNLDTERDFLDVRDVVSAYIQAIFTTAPLERGEIFNIASGIPRRIGDVLQKMFAISGVSPSLDAEHGLMRAGEIPRFVGDSSKARRLLNWAPAHTFEQTLGEIIEYWDRVVQTSPT